jgi:hypothetical protein
MKRFFQLFILCLLPALAPAAVPAGLEITPGLEGDYELCWKGPALQPAPTSDEAPLILRIHKSRPGPDGATIYDLRWMPFEPGDYDLRDLLRGPGRRPIAGLPSMPVHAVSLLPPKSDGRLACPNPVQLNSLSGYYLRRNLMWIIWLAAGAVMFRLLWPRKSTIVAAPALPRPTWADLLQPLIRTAAERPLTPIEQARLDSLFLAFWRQRLDLGSLTAPEAIARLRSDPEASVLLNALDRWLYAPPGPESADVTEVLAYYRDLPAEATGQEVAQ